MVIYKITFEFKIFTIEITFINYIASPHYVFSGDVKGNLFMQNLQHISHI